MFIGKKIDVDSKSITLGLGNFLEKHSNVC